MSTEYNPNLGRSQRDLSDTGIKLQISENFVHSRDLVLGLLLCFKRLYKTIRPSIPKIMQLTHLSRTTVKRAIAEIEKYGLMWHEKGHTGQANIYHLNWVLFSSRFKKYIASCEEAFRAASGWGGPPLVNLMVNINNKYRYIRKRITSTCVEAFNFIFNKGDREDKWKMWDKIEHDRLEKIKKDKALYHAEVNGCIYRDGGQIDPSASRQAAQMFADDDIARGRQERIDEMKASLALQDKRQQEAAKRDEQAMRDFIAKSIDGNLKINYYVERKRMGCV